MSGTSKRLLKSKHDGVHLQLDMLIASVRFQGEYYAGIHAEWQEKSSKQKDMLLKNRLNEYLILMDHNPGIVEKTLVVYVFQLYELFYDGFINFHNIENDIPLGDVQSIILLLASRYLDSQFENQGRADIASFLKQDVTLLHNDIGKTGPNHVVFEGEKEPESLLSYINGGQKSFDVETLRSKVRRNYAFKNWDDEKKVIPMVVSFVFMQIIGGSGDAIEKHFIERINQRLFDDYSLGYIYGFMVGFLNREEKIPQEQLPCIKEEIFSCIFERKGSSLLNRAKQLSAAADEIFELGMGHGFSETSSFLKTGKHPEGLIIYILSGKRIRTTRATNES
jgi:hypothetical protein